MNRFGRLLPSNLLQPSTAKVLAKTDASHSPDISKVKLDGRPSGSTKPFSRFNTHSAGLILALLLCIGSIALCIPISIHGGLSTWAGSTPLEARLEIEKAGNLLVKTYPLPEKARPQEAKLLLIHTPIGAELKFLEFRQANADIVSSSRDQIRELKHAGYAKTILLPPGAREIRIATSNTLFSPVSLHLSSATTYQNSQAQTLTLTSSVVYAQALLALFACGVAYFGKLRVFGWFAWWFISLSAVTLLASGTLSSFVPATLASVIELHFIGALASLFGLATLKLEHEFAGFTCKYDLAARRWFGAWLMTFGVISVGFPHPYVIALIWLSGVAYCALAAVRQIIQIPKSERKWANCLKAFAWSMGALTVSSEILPWFGALRIQTGYSYLFPTLYSAAFTAYAMARVLGAERLIRRDAQRRAETSLKHVGDVVEHTPVAMLSANYKGRLIHGNLRARQIWPSLDWSVPSKLRLDDLLGTQYASLLSGAFHSRDSVDAVVTLPKGEQRPQDMICQLKLFRTGTTIELTLINITDQERMTRVLEGQVSTDPLTKLLNRRGLDQHLRALQTLVNKNEAQASLLFIDLDRFKIVNDLYGHDYGDELLVQIALRARAMSEGRLTIARIGGDEFVVLVPNASLDVACDLAEELRSVISNRPYPVRDKLLTVGACIGVVRLTKGMEPKDSLIYADRACGQAKKGGRGRVERIEASDQLIDEFKSESQLQELMSARLPTERLRIYAQPLVPLSGRAGLAYEILLRYVDENDKVLPPGQLITIAERQGMMSQLDFWVLESTLTFLDQQPHFALNTLFFTINLSGSSINDRRFLSDISKLFDRHAKIAHRITLEITETVALLDSKYTRRFMDAMIAKGVRFALDDFGAGYTSFGYLMDLPADMLKIDGNFIANLSKDSACQRIVRTMSTLAQQLGLQSVAEWVEDEKTLELLISMQIDFAQGYFFSPAKPIEHWINHPQDIDAIQDKAQRYTRVSPPPSPLPAPVPHREAELSALV